MNTIFLFFISFLFVLYICLTSHVHFIYVTHYRKMDKNAWTYGTASSVSSGQFCIPSPVKCLV